MKTITVNSHQNGVAECMNMIILERAKSMQIHARLPKQFWTDAVNMTVYLLNRRPPAALNCGIPEEVWADKEVNLNQLRTFGCISYVHVDLDHKSKLDPNSGGAPSLGTVQVNTTIGFKIRKIERSLDTRM